MGDNTMPAFMTYREAALLYRVLSDADAAAIIKATVEYYLTGSEPDFPGMLAGVFEVMKLGVDRGRESWEQRREHARKGAAARWGKVDAMPEDARALPEDAIQTKPIQTKENQSNPSQGKPKETEEREGEKETPDPDFLERWERAKAFCREMEENARHEYGGDV